MKNPRFCSTGTFLTLYVLTFAGLCFGQDQTLYLAYSTYEPQFQLTSPSDTVVSAAVNSMGQLCVGSLTQVIQLAGNGSLAYEKSVAYPEFVDNLATAIDATGNCYVAAEQLIPGRPLTIAKYDSQGNNVLTLNYTGSGQQVPFGMAVDGSGNIWVTGKTTSNDLQTVNPIQSALNGTQDAFVAEFSSTGALTFSTYFGGSGIDLANALTVDAGGNVYVAGQTSSTDFPLLNPLEGSLTGSQSAFLTKISSAGTLIYSTYLGTTIGFQATGVATDASLDMFVAGAGLLVKLNAAGSAVLYSNSSVQTDGQVAIDGQGNAYTGGCQDSGSCPSLINPIQTDPSAALLFAFDPNGNIIFTSYLGGSGSGVFPYVGLDSAGNMYVESSTAQYAPIPLLNAVNGTYPPPNCYVPNCEFSSTFFAKVALGTGPSFSVPGTIDLPATQVGSTGVLPLPGAAMIYNTGTTDIAISSINISGDFAQTNNCPATLVAATSCSLTVTFTPTAAGARTGAITITDNSPGSPHIIQLTGTGTVPAVTLNPTSLTFPAQGVGTTSSAQNVTLTNSGGASLSITKISISGDFAETNTCGSSLFAGGSCTISVTFTPTTTGTRTGAVTIADNAANSPQMIGLTGTGGAPGLALGVASGSSSSATVTAGDSATYMLTIGGQGVGGTATLSCTGAPRGATCSVPASVNVSATAASTVTVSVTTEPHTFARLVRPGAKLGWAWAMGILGLVVLPGLARGKRFHLRALPFALLLFICSCGGGYNAPPPSQGGTPAGSYTLTVGASIGSTNQSLGLTLTVH